MEKGTIFVYNPTGYKRGEELVGAPRLASLKEKRIAVIWNGKLGGDIFLDRISEGLIGRYGVAGIERINDRGDTAKVLDQDVVERLVAITDASVLGIGD